MNDLDFKRKNLNKQQTTLRKLLTRADQHKDAIRKFLELHAQLHSREMLEKTGCEIQLWSYEDAILENFPDPLIRAIPQNFDHSIAWCLWHIARIEDIVMNILVTDTQQILFKENWTERLGIPFRDTGNEMGPQDINALSTSINILALKSYRAAVGIRTREIVNALEPIDLKKKVDLHRIQKVKDQGALTEAAYGIADYWSRRNIAGLLLMPATRHNLVHLNESFRIKQKLKKQNSLEQKQ
jgi:hypothetical protein